MEVKPDNGLNIGQNAFYQPANAGYGSNWQASEGTHPVKMGDIPLYSDVVSIFTSSLICNLLGYKRSRTQKLNENL